MAAPYLRWWWGQVPQVPFLVDEVSQFPDQQFLLGLARLQQVPPPYLRGDSAVRVVWRRHFHGTSVYTHCNGTWVEEHSPAHVWCPKCSEITREESLGRDVPRITDYLHAVRITYSNGHDVVRYVKLKRSA